MTKVFIAGSRKLSRLSPEVKARIDTMIEKGFYDPGRRRERRRQGCSTVSRRQGLPKRHRPLHDGQLP